MDSTDYKLQLLKKNPANLVEFAKSTMQWVKELDKRPIKHEINKMQSQFHIDHYWILNDDKKIGVVKITRGTYYSLGLSKIVPKDDYTAILKLIEKDLGGWRINRFEASLHDDFLQVASDLGYKVDFSRKKMKLDLKNVKNTSDYNGLISRTYKRGDLSNLIDMFIDAYHDSVDEKIGMFGGNIASSAISSILKGNFGDFRPDLSPIIFEPDTEYAIGASLTTISEGCPFVVIIGVRRQYQSSGLGRKLLSWVIDKVREMDYDEIRLWVTVENEKALKLYESMGFEEMSRIHSLFKIL